MNKFWKIFLISLGSLLGLILIAVLIVLWLVFTPARVTPIVNRQANKMLSCQTEIGRVEPTFFKTFPRFGLEIEGITLINPMPGAQNDTLFHADRAHFAIDIRAFLKREELIISDVVVSDGSANIFYDADGRANYDIFASSDEDDESSDMPFEFMELGSVKLNNMSLSYVDTPSAMNAAFDIAAANLKAYMKRNGDLTFEGEFTVPQLNYDNADMYVDLSGVAADIKGSMTGDDGMTFETAIKGGGLAYDYRSEDIALQLSPVDLKLKGSMQGDRITFDADLRQSELHYVQEGETLADGLQVALTAKGSANLTEDRYDVSLEGAKLTVNELSPLSLDGDAGMDNSNGDITLGLRFEFAGWPVGDLLAVIPPVYKSELAGMSVAGTLTAKGDINGVYNDSSMPVVDTDFKFTGGTVRYPAMIPFGLHDVTADASAHIDMNGYSESYAQIRKLVINTPESHFSTSGRIGNIMGDMSIALDSRVDLLLDELAAAAPEEMGLLASGRVKGSAYTALTMSQLEKMQLNRMKLNGRFAFSNIDFSYEELEMQTCSAMLDFALPNPHPSVSALGFAGIQISSPVLSICMGDGQLYADIENPVINIEVDDNIVDFLYEEPSLLCDFEASKAVIRMDDIYAAIIEPRINAITMPLESNPEHSSIELTYTGKSHYARNAEMDARTGAAVLNFSGVFDPSKYDIIGRYSPHGTLHIDDIEANAAGFTETVYIPAVDMAMDPSSLVINEFKGTFGGLEFDLSGHLNDLDGYFADQQDLKGEFNLDASKLDIMRIMNATSGIGGEEGHAADSQASSQNEESSGPYMVPLGMDIVLFVNIAEATFGESNFTNISGPIIVRDGALVLGDFRGGLDNNVKISIPGADMQVFAMYRPQEPNHIFAGIDIHLYNIEMAQLIKTIPLVEEYFPMLNAVDGQGEFHGAVEFYMNSQYVVKKSTMRGAVSIQGKNLEVIPHDMYRKISRLLLFSKKTKNAFDLSAEATLFKTEVDVYPFEISMDKYKLIVSGRHTTDMDFDYNISVVKSPLPFRLAVNVAGNMDDYKVRLRRNKVPRNFRPVYRGEVSKKQLELREIIRSSLTREEDYQ